MFDELLLGRWNGGHKIKAIIAVRTVFGLGLKESINLLDNEAGFLMTQLQWIALRGVYMLGNAAMLKPLDTNGGENYIQTERYVNDWMVQTYAADIPPINLSTCDPQNDKVITERESEDVS